jgi:threonine/homoserine/homoserine lactone efflux protein
MPSTAAAVTAFALAAGLATVTPGLDTALVLRTAAAEGRHRAMLAGLGIALGVLTWGVATALGLSALLAASSTAYAALRWAGAAYLVWLGVGMLARPRSGFVVDATAADATRADAPQRNWLVRGMLTNLLNPKVAVFYVTFLPQFVPRGSASPRTLMVAFAAIHAVEGLLWFALLSAAAASLARVLRRGGVVRTIDRVTGVVLVAVGVRLVLDR